MDQHQNLDPVLQSPPDRRHPLRIQRTPTLAVESWLSLKSAPEPSATRSRRTRRKSATALQAENATAITTASSGGRDHDGAADLAQPNAGHIESAACSSLGQIERASKIGAAAVGPAVRLEVR